MLKIIHTADVHFDAPFTSLDSKKARQRKEELKETFNNIINIVIDKKADVLLIAGDFFDGETVNCLTIEYINTKFCQIPNVKVFIVAGNHDPKSTRSYYNVNKWADNVHIFNTELEKISLEELNANIYGVSFSRQYQNETLLKRQTLDTSKTNILLIHGDTQNSTTGYNPISLYDIESSNFDYVALGHIHQYSGVNKIGNTYYSYCGSPEPKGFDETGEKGVVYIEIEKDSLKYEFIKTAKRVYHSVELDVTGVQNHNDIINKIVSLTPFVMEDLYKIILKGEVKDIDISVSHLVQIISDKCYFVKIYNQTIQEIDYQTYTNDTTLTGLFVADLLSKIENAKDKELYKDALRMGFDILNNKEVNIVED